MNMSYQLLLNQFATVIFVLTGEEFTAEGGKNCFHSTPAGAL